MLYITSFCTMLFSFAPAMNEKFQNSNNDNNEDQLIQVQSPENQNVLIQQGQLPLKNLNEQGKLLQQLLLEIQKLKQDQLLAQKLEQINVALDKAPTKVAKQGIFRRMFGFFKEKISPVYYVGALILFLHSVPIKGITGHVNYLENKISDGFTQILSKFIPLMSRQAVLKENYDTCVNDYKKALKPGGFDECRDPDKLNDPTFLHKTSITGKRVEKCYELTTKLGRLDQETICSYKTITDKKNIELAQEEEFYKKCLNYLGPLKINKPTDLNNDKITHDCEFIQRNELSELEIQAKRNEQCLSTIGQLGVTSPQDLLEVNTSCLKDQPLKTKAPKNSSQVNLIEKNSNEKISSECIQKAVPSECNSITAEQLAKIDLISKRYSACRSLLQLGGYNDLSAAGIDSKIKDEQECLRIKNEELVMLMNNQKVKERNQQFSNEKKYLSDIGLLDQIKYRYFTLGDPMTAAKNLDENLMDKTRKIIDLASATLKFAGDVGIQANM